MSQSPTSRSHTSRSPTSRSPTSQSHRFQQGAKLITKLPWGLHVMNRVEAEVTAASGDHYEIRLGSGPRSSLVRYCVKRAHEDFTLIGPAGR